MNRLPIKNNIDICLRDIRNCLVPANDVNIGSQFDVRTLIGVKIGAVTRNSIQLLLMETLNDQFGK